MKGEIITEKVKLRDLRLKMGLSQQELADSLRMNSRYISMVETGSKLFSDKMLKKVELLMQTKQHATAPPSSTTTPCRYPDGCDMEAELGDVKERLAAMEGQLDTVIRLLGASLGSALPTHREHNQTQSNKAHPHRAAG